MNTDMCKQELSKS